MTPLMPLIADLPPYTASTAVLVDRRDAQVTSSSSKDLNFVVPEADPYVETPMTFVPGIEAKPSREPQPEPVGSGPFGF